MDPNFRNDTAHVLGSICTTEPRQILLAYHRSEHKFREDFDRLAFNYYVAYVQRFGQQSNALVTCVEAVIPIMLVVLSGMDRRINEIFSMDVIAANTTRQLASEAQQFIAGAQQQSYGYGQNNMVQQRMYPSDGFARSNTQSNSLTGVTASQPSTVSMGVVLPTSQNNYPTAHAAQNLSVGLPRNTQGNTSALITENTEFGLPKLHDRRKEILTYQFIDNRDAYISERSVDPREHNAIPGFAVTPSTIGMHPMVDHTEHRNSISAEWVCEVVESPTHTRELKDAQGKTVHCFCDVKYEEIVYTIDHPIIDVIKYASEISVDVPSSVVVDTDVIQRIIPTSNAQLLQIIQDEFLECINAVDLSKRLSILLKEHANNRDEYAVYNGLVNAFVDVINQYLLSSCTKANLPKATIDGITDIPELVDSWLKPIDKFCHRNLSDTTAFKQWLNHRFKLKAYEGIDCLTIQSRNPTVYTTLSFEEFHLSFADNCDKAILLENEHTWLYNLFFTHLPKKEAPRPYHPVRYFTRDGVIMDVTPINITTGIMLVRRVN